MKFALSALALASAVIALFAADHPAYGRGMRQQWGRGLFPFVLSPFSLHRCS